MFMTFTPAQTIMRMFNHFYFMVVYFIDGGSIKIGGVMNFDEFIYADYFADVRRTESA